MSGRRSRLRRPVLIGAVLVAVAGKGTLAWAGFQAQRAVSGTAVEAAALEPPSGLQVSGASVANLSWTPSPSAFAAGVRVLRSTTGGGGYGVIADGTVTPGTTYHYVVQSYYRNWSSASSEASLTAAASPLRQQASAGHGNNSATSTTATLAQAPSVGSLLVVVAASRKTTTFAMPAAVPAWTAAVATAPGSELQQTIYYKLSTGAGDQSLTVSHGGQIGAVGVQVYEFSGSLALTLGTGSASGAGTTLSSGSVNVALPHRLVFAAIVGDAGSTNNDSTWTDGFVGTSFQKGTNVANRAVFASAWTTTTGAGAYGTGVTGTVSANWRGQIVAFG